MSESIREGSKLLRDYGLTIIFAVVVAVLIRTFAIEAFHIPTSLMRPTLEAGDTVFVAKWPFGLRLFGKPLQVRLPLLTVRQPKYGEVVVYPIPDGSSRISIKRVIGLPGDSVEIRDGEAILNGKRLALPFPKNTTCGQERILQTSYSICKEPPVIENLPQHKVPEGSVFVLADLRTQPSPPAQATSSSLSKQPKQKTWDIVPITSLKGSALWVWLSIEPSGNTNATWFSRIRFERMFHQIH